MFSDKQRLDWLQKQLARKHYTGKCIYRESSTGRGMRLHETSMEGASSNVRTAIDKAIMADLRKRFNESMNKLENHMQEIDEEGV